MEMASEYWKKKIFIITDVVSDVKSECEDFSGITLDYQFLLCVSPFLKTQIYIQITSITAHSCTLFTSPLADN